MHRQQNSSKSNAEIDTADAQSDQPIRRQPLRVWPGVVAVALQWLLRFVVPIFVPGALALGVFGGLLGGLVILVWWAFLSRAPRSERWGAIVLMIVAMAASSRLIHHSVLEGMMGMMFYVYAIPLLCLAFVGWALVSRNLSDGARRLTMVATIILSCGVWTLVRSDGMSGEADTDFAWRWAQTDEERLVAQAAKQPAAFPSTQVAAEAGADWPGFRGPNRDGIIRGVRLETDWTTSPPAELWHRPVGPGWSSFSVRGNLFYTQEQRGDDEMVTCYNLSNGLPVWQHGDKARFWETTGGAGPRGTPTLSQGRVYTLGGTGILNVLDAQDGAVVWSRDAAQDTKAKLPMWGFSSSPLVLDDMVIVTASGALVAYDLQSGEPRWFGPSGGEGYCSPHLMTIDGVTQILHQSGDGLSGVAPADGKVLWEHAWAGYPIVQPVLTANGDFLISASATSGTRRLAVGLGPGGWTVEERWTSSRLKAYYSDISVHNGNAFGFDGSLLTCIDVADGTRKWKGGRFGAGQLFLLADQGLLLVLSEKGELALVEASPDKFKELARIKAVKGITWNHPVLVGDVLLVRNAKEMVAFRLSLVADSAGITPY